MPAGGGCVPGGGQPTAEASAVRGAGQRRLRAWRALGEGPASSGWWRNLSPRHPCAGAHTASEHVRQRGRRARQHARRLDTADEHVRRRDAAGEHARRLDTNGEQASTHGDSTGPVSLLPQRMERAAASRSADGHGRSGAAASSGRGGGKQVGGIGRGAGERCSPACGGMGRGAGERCSPACGGGGMCVRGIFCFLIFSDFFSFCWTVMWGPLSTTISLGVNLSKVATSA